MTIGSYGIGLELCFFVNAVFTLWGGLYRRIAKRQEVLSEGAAAMDRILSQEQYESIAIKKLHRTINCGIRFRRMLWLTARVAGAVASTAIYVASVSFADVKLPDVIVIGDCIVANWSLVEALTAYLSPGLVIAMAGISIGYEWNANAQLNALQEAADKLYDADKLDADYANVRQGLFDSWSSE